MSDYSLCAYDEELRSEYITLPGGHRIGVAGRTHIETVISALSGILTDLTGAISKIMLISLPVMIGVLVVLMIVIITACALPILKMMAIYIIYKISAAVVQPVCDPRIVKCIDAISSFTALALSAAVILLSF